MISLVNLCKTYKVKERDIDALKDINLTINDGEIFGIIGLSGAGKSTLVRCINLLERPTSGKVIIDGEDLTLLNKKQLNNIRKNIGMIFQSFNLFEQRNVLENVLFPLKLIKTPKEEALEIARHYLELVGLSDKEKSYPSLLSGGEKQRVAIARALVTKPKILLCDEATSALDPTTANQILDILKELNKKLNLTIIVIAHQMSVIERICNRVAVLSKNTVVENGDTSKVFLDPKAEITKELIYSGHTKTKLSDSNLVRIKFDGDIDTPLLSSIVQDCNILVSVVYANSYMIEDKVYGQLVIRLPYYEDDIKKLKAYLTTKGFYYEEVSKDDLAKDIRSI